MKVKIRNKRTFANILEIYLQKKNKLRANKTVKIEKTIVIVQIEKQPITIYQQ
jgi:hypothetical protein